MTSRTDDQDQIYFYQNQNNVKIHDDTFQRDIRACIHLHLPKTGHVWSLTEMLTDVLYHLV